MAGVTFDPAAASRLIKNARQFENRPAYPQQPFRPRVANDRYWFSAQNTSGSDIPGYALVAISGSPTLVGDFSVPNVVQPNPANFTPYAACNPFGIKSGQYGRVTTDWPCDVLYDDSGSPAVGDTWGANASQWSVSKGCAPAFQILGQTSTSPNLVLVTPCLVPRLIGGTLSGTLTAGGNCTVSISYTHQGSTPPGTVTVYDADSLFTGSSGNKFRAHENLLDGTFYFDWVQCSS